MGACILCDAFFLDSNFFPTDYLFGTILQFSWILPSLLELSLFNDRICYYIFYQIPRAYNKWPDLKDCHTRHWFLLCYSIFYLWNILKNKLWLMEYFTFCYYRTGQCINMNVLIIEQLWLFEDLENFTFLLNKPVLKTGLRGWPMKLFIVSNLLLWFYLFFNVLSILFLLMRHFKKCF